MKKSFLITGRISPLLVQLVEETLKRGHQVSVLTEGEAEALSVADEFRDRFEVFQTSQRTGIGMKSVLLTLETTGRNVDHAVHVFHPEPDGKTLAELDLSDVYSYMDSEVKGLIFPVREILSYFATKKRGSLSFVCVGGLNSILPPLKAAASGAIQELAKSLFYLYQNEPFAIRGIHAALDSDLAALAAYTCDTVLEDSPKTSFRWLKYGARTGLFGLRS